MLTKRRCWSHCIAKCERWAAALTWNLIELNLSLWLPCAESFGSQNTSYEQAMHLGLWNMQSLKGPLPQSSKLIWLHCLDQVCVWSGSRLSDKNSCCSFVVLRSLSILHPLFLHQHSALLDFVNTVGLWVTMSLSLNILKANFVDLQSASVHGYPLPKCEHDDSWEMLLCQHYAILSNYFDLTVKVFFFNMVKTADLCSDNTMSQRC